jgi:hypothetical protein
MVTDVRLSISTFLCFVMNSYFFSYVGLGQILNLKIDPEDGSGMFQPGTSQTESRSFTDLTTTLFLLK